MASQPSVPPPAPLPPKKKGWLFWGLLGCGGLLVLFILVVFLGGVYIWNRVPKSPAQLAAALITANNPDAEVVSIDEGRGLLQVKDKKTGKIITINLEDAKKGKITFTGEGNEKITLNAGEPGKEALMQVQTKEGSASWGAGIPKDLPAWVPVYPGAQAAAGGAGQSNKGQGGTLTLQTSDPVDKVAGFYQEALKKSGFSPALNAEGETKEGSPQVVSASDPATKRNITVTITKDTQGTGIVLFYEADKP
jgi:hypothetical protein